MDVLIFMEKDLSARGGKFVTDLSGTLRLVFCDPVQFQQVLNNPVRNAADSMPQNTSGVRELTLQYDCKVHDMFEICVSDTGPGIPAGQNEKIFEPYYTTKASGIGLGLSLSRAIATAYGGS